MLHGNYYKMVNWYSPIRHNTTSHQRSTRVESVSHRILTIGGCENAPSQQENGNFKMVCGMAAFRVARPAARPEKMATSNGMWGGSTQTFEAKGTVHVLNHATHLRK